MLGIKHSGRTADIGIAAKVGSDAGSFADRYGAGQRARSSADRVPGVEVVDWFVMMGIGQVAILRLPPDRLCDTNRIIESAAWGGYRTEFYPTYDYRPCWEQAKRQAG